MLAVPALLADGPATTARGPPRADTTPDEIPCAGTSAASEAAGSTAAVVGDVVWSAVAVGPTESEAAVDATEPTAPLGCCDAGWWRAAHATPAATARARTGTTAVTRRRYHGRREEAGVVGEAISSEAPHVSQYE